MAVETIGKIKSNQMATTRANQLKKKYGSLAHEVSCDILNNIPIQFYDVRGMWIEIRNQLNPNNDE